MTESVARHPRSSATERLRGWRPEIRHSVPGPDERLPPGPRTHPAVQSLKVWGARNTYFPAMRERFGDTFTLSVAPIGRMVVLCGLEDVRTVTLGGPDVFPVAENNALLVPILGKRTVATIDGAAHKSERKRMMPAFHGERIATAVSIIERMTEEEVATWPVGTPFSLVDRMRELTLKVIVRLVVGVEEPDRAARLATALLRVVDIRTLDLLMWVWPQLSRFGPWRNAVRGLDHADELLFREIERRRRDPERHRRPDMLSMLIDGDPDDELVRSELVTLLTGGHETTAVATSWMFERLIRDPRALERVRAGLDDPKDEYRKGVVKETMRVRPAVHSVGRRITRPVELGGYRLPAGTFVWPSIAAVHTDRRIWGHDVAEFRPERWLEPDVPVRAYIPFGGGAHRCLGAQFAEAEMDAILRVVLRHVDLRPDRPEDEPGVMRNIIMVPKRGVRVRAARVAGS